jgi:hypothetical protein
LGEQVQAYSPRMITLLQLCINYLGLMDFVKIGRVNDPRAPRLRGSNSTHAFRL